MNKFILFIVFTFLTMGCSSIPKQWTAFEGSKSDGTITLTYVYRPILDTKPTSDNRAITLASSKCALWGYISAEPFGEETRSCHTSTNDGSCTSWRVKKVYQCLVK